MRELFQQQLAKASRRTGQVDLDILADLVAAAYEDAERDRQRTDRSISLMADELQQAHMRLLEAFNVVPEGLALLNSNGQYVVFNKRFLEIYDSYSDKIKVGTSFEDAVRTGVERGHYLDAIGREESWLAERLAQHSRSDSSSEQHIVGDRWIQVQERRLPDGGSVGIRIDITDLKRREEVLKRRSEQLLEAQHLGKIGDWSFRFGEATIQCSPQIYSLLGHTLTGTGPTYQQVLGAYADNSAEIVLHAQSEIVRTRQIKSVDARMKRADGSVGDFTVTIKPIIVNDGVAGFSGTIQDISARKTAERNLEKLAYYDPLTGLPNRALFQREVNEMLTRCARTGASGGLLLLDLDRFKEVNDSLGHVAGDELLRKVAQLISRILGNRHFCARLGGDEFAIMVSDSAGRDELDDLASAIITAVSGTILLEYGEVNIGTSIGIARLPADGTNLVDLQRHADLALYRAKDDGRNRARFFEPEMSGTVQHKLALARELRRSINENTGLSVHYQPQVQLSSQRVTGYEALMRWVHPTFGNVPPSEFIPIAESSQLICELGLWILRQAAIQSRLWLDAGETQREIAVNVSAAQIWHTDFVKDVASILDETGIPPGMLCLELTESLLADHSEGRVRRVLNELKQLGVKLALDDFGTDYSSLGYLTQLPFDKLKIDKIFIDDIENSERARKLLGGIIALGHGLGMTIVAEGAETAEQTAILQGFNCDIVQGYIFARPTPAADALAFACSLDGTTPGVMPEPTIDRPRAVA